MFCVVNIFYGVNSGEVVMKGGVIWGGSSGEFVMTGVIILVDHSGLFVMKGGDVIRINGDVVIGVNIFFVLACSICLALYQCLLITELGISIFHSLGLMLAPFISMSWYLNTPFPRLRTGIIYLPGFVLVSYIFLDLC